MRQHRLEILFRHNYFRRLLAGFVILSVLPVSMTFMVVYFTYVKVAIQELADNNVHQIEQISKESENAFSELQHTFTSFIIDPDVMWFVSHHFYDDITRYYKVTNKFKTLQMGCKYIDSAYLYYSSYNFIICIPDRMDYGFNSSESLEDKSWLSNYKEAPFYAPVFRVGKVNKENVPMVSIYYPIRDIGSRSNSVLVVNIRLSVFEDMAKSLVTSFSGNLYMKIGTQVNQIYRQNDFNIDYKDLNNLGTINKKHVTLSTEKTKYIVSGAHTNDYDVQFFSVVQQSVLTTRILRLSIIFWLAYIGVILLLIILAGVFTSFLYKPVSNMLKITGNDTLLSKISNKLVKEFDVVIDCYTSLLVDNNAIKTLWHRHLADVRDKFFNNLVSSLFCSDDEVKRHMDELDISIKGTNYIVILLYISKGYQKPSKWKNPIIHDICRVSKEIINQEGISGEVFEDIGGHVCIIMGNYTIQETQKESVAFFCEKLLACIHKQQIDSLCMGVSRWVDTLANIPIAYQQAYEAVTSSIISPNSEMIYYEKIQDILNPNIEYAIFRNNFFSLLNNKEGTDAETLSGNIISIAVTNCLNREYALAFYMRVFTDHMVFIEDRFPTIYNTIVKLNLYTELSNCTTSSEVRDFFTNFYEKTLKLYNAEHSVPIQDVRLKKILEYVETHCTEDISLSSVANQASISPAYLSRIFKENMSCNFHDHLTMLRMIKARELLTTTSVNVENIAQLSGFGSKLSLLRAFRRIEGCTPNEYRLYQAGHDRTHRQEC